MDQFLDRRLIETGAQPLATPTEIGELVSLLCEKSISERSRLIAAVEMHASSSNMRDAVDSLRSLASGRPEPAPPPYGRGSGAPGATFPPPRQGATSATRGPAYAGAAIAASLAMIVGILAVGGYMLLGRRSGADGVGITSSAAALPSMDDAGRNGALLPATTGRGTASAAPMPATSCPDGMTIVPGGRFFMGSDDDLPAERPAHKVIMHAYCMDKLEVTTDEYRACSDRGDCNRAGLTNKWDGIAVKDAKAYDPLCNASDAARGRHPMNCIDWNAADRFCKAEGKRLPTEAEWEFAARGSDGRRYPWGDAPPSVNHLNACGAECVGWGRKHGVALEGLFTESDAWATTAPVGSFPQGASRWGIEDLVGNVWEWTADYYADYSGADDEDPVGPASGTTRVMRGGAWNGAYADWVRPSFRFHSSAETRSHGVGFRSATTP